MLGLAEPIDGITVDWLLEPADPAVRHLALRQIVGRPATDAEVVEARKAAMASRPIAPVLAAQDPEGWWVKPGGGYSPKYSGTVWSLIFLDQMGADGADPRIRTGCEYLLVHTQAGNGGLAIGMSGDGPEPSRVVHCLNGNLLRALIDFGRLDDERVQRALAWQAAAITGDGMGRWYATTPGPGFLCGPNAGRPCAWGAAKAVLALARVPAERRSPAVARALEAGAAFLLSRDPAVADYPMPPGNTKPNGSWFKLGFPSGYVADVLQVLEALSDAGAAGNARLGPAFDWLLEQRGTDGRWANNYTYQGKMVRDIDRTGRPSKWVTLRALRVLKARAEALR
ncbi:MAG: nitrogen fixation protein NifH [Candidatus Limnocylindrales bacterium]|jgi:hypothetical protein